MRRRRRKKRNPSGAGWLALLLVGGALGAAGWFVFLRKKEDPYAQIPLMPAPHGAPLSPADER